MVPTQVVVLEIVDIIIVQQVTAAQVLDDLIPGLGKAHLVRLQGGQLGAHDTARRVSRSIEMVSNCAFENDQYVHIVFV